MIVRSIRLKNIKSYGEGPEGAGITVGFEAGVNRVAGRNGHGKTTLIESLGYALFLSEPRFEEKFGLERYLLRNGEKAGEIDIVFEHAGEVYRVERGVGQASKRRAKVIDCSDGSICAEGDQEVARFLSTTLGLPQPEQLAEIFSKLIGVKQGRLTWPFDSKPSEAKRFFEPLFDVAVFRECFERLKPAVESFQNQTQEQRRLLAIEEQKVADRATAPQELADAQKKIAGLEQEQTTAVEAREAARKEKDLHELKERTLATAKAQKEKAELSRNAANERRADAEKQLKASEAAQATLREAEPSHLAFQKAETALRELEQTREKRDGLQKQRDMAESERKDRSAKAGAASEQSDTFEKQRREKDAAAKTLADQIGPLAARLAATKATHEAAQTTAATASQDRATVRSWIKGLAGAVAKLRTAVDEITTAAKGIAAWDAALLSEAKTTEQTAATRLKTLEGELSKARGLRTSLQQQLKEISGGLCPFLKEACKQFNPEKVKADLDAQDAAIRVLTKQEEEAASHHAETSRRLKELEAAETKLNARREQQRRDIAKYLTDCGSLVSADALAALKRLGEWETRLGEGVTPTTIPTNAIAPESLGQLQAQLEHYKNAVELRWKENEAMIAARLAETEKAKTTRQADETTHEHLLRQAMALEKEIATLKRNSEEKAAAAARFSEEMKALEKRVAQYDEQLKAYAGLEAQSAVQRQNRDSNRGGHERYLQVKPAADDAAARRQRFERLDAELRTAEQAATEAAAALNAAQSDFDAGKLAEARNAFQQKHDAVTAIDTSLKYARAALPQAEKRVEEWRTAGAERDRLANELARLDAAIELAELARRTLQKTAPAVAQHLCDRIAGNAQKLFNQINPDPIQLSWDAERYSLTITPGDRRFAMLSGGEQTKLALALTLAMIEEFGGLRFCIFDEPTYGVDAESRQKLADAILSVQDAAGLDQLLLVSHDDAFEGKAEHTVLLSKSAVAGSSVAEG